MSRAKDYLDELHEREDALCRPQRVVLSAYEEAQMAGRPLNSEIIRPAEEGEYDELAAEPNFLGVCVRRTAPGLGYKEPFMLWEFSD